MVVVLSSFVAAAAEPAPFELVDGDRVVFLGNTLIEREQKYGYWELMLTMAWPERNVTFRNLGWSGDTVWGESRAGFGTQADGYKALVEQVNAAKPTVIFVGYGNVEAFAGEAGLPRFVEGFEKLLDDLERTKARIVVLGPIEQDATTSKNPAAAQYNQQVARYAAAMKLVADGRQLTSIDLVSASHDLHQPSDNFRFASTTNGVDLTNAGYIRLFKRGIGPALGIPTRTKFQDDPYHYSSFLFMAKLPELIIKKNELFFHRWRPQNETYLFGFRKHEQGNNAKEVFEFDPLVAAEEKKIAELREKLAAELKEAGDAK